jgi:hypothetical protein
VLLSQAAKTQSKQIIAKSMATAIQDLDGQNIHFIPDESCRQFNEDPSYYLGTRLGSTFEPGCMVSVSNWIES